MIRRAFGLGRTRRAAPRILSSFDPTHITGLIAWYRSDKGITLNGSTVSAWADQSGNGHHALQGSSAKQPGYLATGGPTGVPAIDFSVATGAVLSTGAFTIAEPIEWCVACRCSNVNATNFLVNQSNSLTVHGITSTTSGGSCIIAVSDNSQTTSPNQTLSSGTDFIVNGNFNGSNISGLYIDNGTLHGGDGSSNGAIINIGNQTRTTSTVSWNSLIEEVTLFNHVLSAADRKSLTEYMGSRYGISVP